LSAAEQRKPNVNLSAPIGSIDLRAFDDNGTPYEIFACYDCLPWHAEVAIVEDKVLVRERHAIDCPQFQRLLADDTTEQ
jgi:hypothetical protein